MHLQSSDWLGGKWISDIVPCHAATSVKSSYPASYFPTDAIQEENILAI